MQLLTRHGGTAVAAAAVAAAAAAAAAAATTAISNLTTSNNNNNNNNNNNLTVALMRTTTKTNANSKIYKRRRRRRSEQIDGNISKNSSNKISTAATAAAAITTTAAAAAATRTTAAAATTTIRATATKTTTKTTTTTTKTEIFKRNYNSKLSRTGAYLTLLLLTTTCSLCSVAVAAAANAVSGTGSGSAVGIGSSDSSDSADTVAGSVSGSVVQRSPCAPHHWWDPLQDKCMLCTSCLGEMITLRPCQLHIDTVCGSIYDLKIDWVVLAKTEPNWTERRKSSSEYEQFDQPTPLQHLTHEQLQQLHEEAAAALPLDWQTGALFIAVLACLLFFSVAACILIHHMRQWRRMERRLDQDVEELSTKLMAKLAEVQSLDGGTFFIGNADALRGLPASAVQSATSAQSGIFQPQHVLLPAEKHAKHQERRVLRALQPGNVYIEENNGLGIGVMPGLKG